MIVKSFILIEKNDRYLLIQEAGFKNRGKWFLPGGRARRNEDPADAVERETWEEAGVRVKARGIFYVKCFTGLFSNRITVFYTGEITEGKPKTFEDKHSIQARWFTYDEIRKLPLRQKMTRLLDRYRKNMGVMPVRHFKLGLSKTPLKKLI